MTSSQSEIEALVRLTWDAIEARPDRRGGRRVAMPERIDCDCRDNSPRFSDSFPVLDHLERALELTSQGPLAELGAHYARVREHIPWSQNPGYDESNCDRSLLDGYAYAAFSGPDAPLLCEVPRGGLLLMGPGVTYPGHNHAPREVYLVLTPGAQWRLDDGEWFDVEAGDLIFHDSWQMHAMRTGTEPMLAYAGWLDVGDRRAIGWSEVDSAARNRS